MGMFKYVIALLLLTNLLIAKEMSVSIYDFKVQTIDGEEISLNKYRGKTLLIVNVASECGLTYQYEGLEKLYTSYF